MILLVCEMAQQVKMPDGRLSTLRSREPQGGKRAASICPLTSTGMCGTNISVDIHKLTKYLIQKFKMKRMLKCVAK